MDVRSPQELAAISEVLVKALLPAFVALSGLAVNEIRRWIATRTRNTTVIDTMAILTALVMTVVQKIAQTAKDKSGPEMKKEAMAEIADLYGEKGIKDLAARLGTSQDATLRYIGALIEQAVYLLRNPPAAPVVFDPNVFGAMTEAEKQAQLAEETH